MIKRCRRNFKGATTKVVIYITSAVKSDKLLAENKSCEFVVYTLDNGCDFGMNFKKSFDKIAFFWKFLCAGNHNNHNFVCIIADSDEDMAQKTFKRFFVEHAEFKLFQKVTDCYDYSVSLLIFD